MYAHYLYWQFVAAPKWLFSFYINTQLLLWRSFSVGTMLRTLFAHWRQDRESYLTGSITGMLRVLALNTISRAIGFVIRLFMVVFWFFIEIFVSILGVVFILLWLAWPLLILVGLVTGAVYFMAGGYGI